MKKLLRTISILLIIANLLMLPFSSYAASGTTSTTSDNTLLSKWKGYGLIDESMTNSDLSKPIAKIDFIRYINGLLKPSKQVDIGFSDVPKNSWYGDEIAKAVASGYVTNKDKTNYNPFDNITRLDAAVMIAHAFELELKDKNSINRITDAEKLEADQLASLGAVIEKGYLSEISAGRYAPLGVLKLIDAIQMLDKCSGQLVAKSGTVTKDVPGNMLINTGLVTLENVTVNGDLIIGEGVANGNVRLEDTIVKGRLIIRGGGPNSVTLINTKLGGSLIVEKSAGDVHVELFGTSEIEQTYLKSGCILTEENLSGKGFVNVTANQAVIDNQTANLQGNFDNIIVNGSNINVKLKGDAQNISIAKDTEGSFSVNGNVETLTTQASQNTLELLAGTISKLSVDTGAKGNKIIINGEKTNTAKINTLNINEDTAVNFDKGTVEELTLESSAEGSDVKLKSGALIKNFYVKAGATVTGQGQIANAYVYSNNVSMGIKPSGSYINNSPTTNTDGSSTNKNPSLIKVYGRDITLQVGKTEKVVAAVIPTSSTLSYSSADSTIATVDDKGMLTANSVGATSVYISASKEGYTSNVATINVTVTSDNVTTSGAIQISPLTQETGTATDFTLTYTAGDNMLNGKVIIKLPSGFSALASDTVRIGSASTTEKTLEQSQRPDPQTLLLTNLNLTKGDTIVVKLKNKVVPPAGQYEFSSTSDADGTGPKLPTSDGKAIFTSDSLKVLTNPLNYTGPEGGSTGGTTKLTIKGFNGATKWFIKVQAGEFGPAPKFDEILPVSATEYFEYTSGKDIPVTVGQHLRLVATDDTNKIKAYSKDIIITDAMIRKYDAGQLKLKENYNAPAPGIQAGTVSIGGLKYTGADHFMIKVQDTPLSTVFVNTEFVGATNYTSGDDILVNINQHIILAAVDSKNMILAYTDIQVESNMVSAEAGKLVAGNNPDSNLSIPTYGSLKGTTKIETLNKGNFDIDKWMIVLLGKEAIKPALNAPVDQYQKYTKNSDGSDNAFGEYIADSDIPAVGGQHLLLVGVKGNNIKAYADLLLDASTQIRQASAPEIPTDNIGAVVMGSEQFSTRIQTLSLTGSAILVDAEKFMVKVQNEELKAPQMNSLLTGASDYTANTNIKPVSAGQIIVLLATDKAGRIKAYKNIAVDGNKIRPANALLLKNPSDYQFVAANTTVDATRIISLPAGGPSGVAGFKEWRYKLQPNAFEVPYIGSSISDTKSYNPGDEIINVSEGQHVLLIAVDTTGGTLAYADEILNLDEIKQPLAEKLNSSADVAKDFNYSIPEPGLKGGQTKIAKLYLGDIVGANKWLYKISSTAIATPEKNSTLEGQYYSYVQGTSIDVKEGEYLLLFAVDSNNSNRIKKYACIELKPEYISLPVLKSPDNYTISMGSTAGTTNLKDLKFTGLVGATKWMYAVGSDSFPVPAKGMNVSSLLYSVFSIATTTAAISINPNEYIMLLAVDDTGLIKGYANIQVLQGQIKPVDAPEITGYILEKGSSEGTTRFSKLVDLTTISGATQWRICVQSGAFTTPIGKDTTVTGAEKYDYTLTSKPDIHVNANEHILLLATDSSGKVKAYKDIEVAPALIQTPFAKELKPITDYTGPYIGATDGTTKFTLMETNIPKAAGETIVWKYKTATQESSQPHFDENASAYTATASGYDIPVQPNNWLMIVATINNEVKAYFQLQIGSSSIKPKEAPKLQAGKNYTGLLAGSEPGTTKIDGLDPIGLTGFAGWVVKAATTAEPLMLNSYFGTPLPSIGNIKIKMEKYVVLAAVDKDGKVIAYANIEITNGSQISPAGFDNNYLGPQMGTVKGTTRFEVSLNGLDSADGFVARVVDSPVSLTAGEEITTVTGTDNIYTNYRAYTSLANIAVNPGQYVVLIAVAANKVVAYANIQIPETSINAGNAIKLESTKNYILQPGTGTGTVKFTNFSAFGVPGFDNNKWIVKFVNSPIATPILNTVVENAPATGYVSGSDLVVTQGKYIVLYAVNSTNAIKGYDCIQVRPEDLVIDPLPVPGADYYTTKLDAAQVVAVPTNTTLKYIVQKSSAGLILKDGKIAGLTVYQPGYDIAAVENDYLLFAAVDAQDCIQAYKEIKITSAMLKTPNTAVTLSGTLISAPVSEGDIAAGGKTLVITLNDGRWASDIASKDTQRNALYDGFKLTGTTDSAQWTKVLTALKTAGQASTPYKPGITRTSDNVVTINLPAVDLPTVPSKYEITKNQTITLTIPKSCIIGDVPVTAGQTITIEALASAKLTGNPTSTTSYKATDIIAGGKALVITLTGATWVNNINNNATIKNALLAGIKAEVDTGNQWSSLIANGKVVNTSSTVVTITLPAAPDYSIPAEQVITLTEVPTCAAIGTSFDIPSTGTITITPVAPAVIPAAIQSVAAVEAGKSYKLGDSLNINVKFNQKVTVTGTPTLALQTVTGSTASKNATYDSGTGTDTLLFKYTVGTGDKSQQLEYKAGAISGTIYNMGSSTAANKALPSIGGGFSLGESKIIIDGVVPQFVSGYPKPGAIIGTNEAEVLAKLTDTATIYYVVVPYSADNVAPSVNQIKAGTANTTVVTKGTFDVVAANTQYPIALTNLTDSTGYTVYMYAEDSCGNKSAVTSAKIDNKPPVMNIKVTPSDYSINVVVNSNEIGNIYAVALPNDSAAPTSLNGYTGAKVTQAVTAANVNKDITLKITKVATSATGSAPLVTSTDYDIYVACEDTASPTKNLTAPVKVDAKTIWMDLTKVDVDLANNSILNTNTKMEYSLDGANWIPCNATNTPCTFKYNDDTEEIIVYIREIGNISNALAPIKLTKADDSIITRAMIDYNIVDGKIYNNSSINLQYRINTEEWKPISAHGFVEKVVFVPGTLYLRTAVTSPTAAGKDSKLPSKAKAVDGIPDKSEAPNLTGNDTTNKIDGLLSIHQYSIDGGASWISGDLANSRNDFAGTKKVLVRFKATKTQFPSEEQIIEFTANVLKVVATPAAGATKATVTITFEENTNKAGQTLTPTQVKDWFSVKSALGVPHEWGTDLQGKFNSTGNVLTITFNSMAGSTIEIGDTVTVTGAAILNTNNPPVPFTSTGMLTGSVPKVLSIKAKNTNGDNVFSNGEQLVITFDQETKEAVAISDTNIADYLILTDEAGNKKNWSNTNAPKVTLVWTQRKILTITINDVSDTQLAVGDKIRVSPDWGLTDATGTSAACYSTVIIGGSFVAP